MASRTTPIPARLGEVVLVRTKDAKELTILERAEHGTQNY